MKRKNIVIWLLIAVTILLTGCNMSTIDQMYCLPKRSQAYEDLQKVIQELLTNNMLEVSEDVMAPLQPWQRYHVYPARHLDAVHWSITGKCNFNCRHCLVSAPDACHPQLPFEDCLKIMDQIARCGIHQVDITGGEPLVRQDYEEFFKELSQRGIFIRTFFTNASLLDDAVLDALNDGKIQKCRHTSYLRLYEELKPLQEWQEKKR